MLTWTRAELATLARWQWAHAWQLDEGDWTIEITPDSITCDRPSLDNAEAEQIGREMMLQSWGIDGPIPWNGRVLVRRGSSSYDKDWREGQE